MKVEEMKAKNFPQVTYDQWKETAEASLKGKSVDRLSTRTYENIPLKPLYLQNDLLGIEMDQFSGEGQYTRGFYKGGYLHKPWKSGQFLQADSISDLQQKLDVALNTGQDVLSFSLETVEDGTFDELKKLLSEFNQYPLYIKTKDLFPGFAAVLTKAGLPSSIKGLVGTDVISEHAAQGFVPDEQGLSLYFEGLNQLKVTYPQLKTVLVDTAPYHATGANAVQEVAIALAEAVFYLEWLTSKGWAANDAVQKLVFNFAIGPHFFMEIAKLRAFRKVWSALAKAYGITGDAIKVTISGETSEFSLSKLDRHVNLLRTGSEAFSAVLGGVDYLQVTPFDRVNGQISAVGERMAKNIPLLLKNESHLEKVIDPAGGSYFVESLTSEIGTAAWERFLKIEDEGGILSSLKEGTLQHDLKEVMEKRVQDLASRKKSMIGTNIYSDLAEVLPLAKSVASGKRAEKTVASFAELVGQIAPDTKLSELFIPFSGEKVQQLEENRLSAPFEALREKATNIGASRPVIAGLIGVGKLKEYKPRADYVAGVLSAGGIAVKQSGDCQSIEDAVKFIQETKLPYYCICGKDETYSELGSQLIEELKAAAPFAIIDIAGKLNKDTEAGWQQAGLAGTIYAGQDLLEKLSFLLTIWEGETTNE